MGKIAGIFPIGDTGESFAVAEWYPDPELIAQELFKLADELEDWTEPLTEARAAMIYDTELHFETQSDPYGTQWTALDEAYKTRKLAAGDGDMILQRSGDLKSAATSEKAWLIEERSIVFDSSVLPFYGEYHQRGTAGDFGPILHKLRTGQQLTNEEARHPGFAGGRGQNLPQRMFIGLDEDTIDEVEAIFVKWLDSKVDEFIGGGIVDTGTVTTTTGLTGSLTNVPLFGGGVAVRGTGGRFIGRAK